jgi:phosphoribosylformylglycinamidine synthase
LDPEVGMKVVKIGGPAYRIGMGGGSASSRADGDARSDLDFNAVQRGDAEMEQKMNRVIRACCELGERNPFVQLHDQGCGGNCNVLKEVLDPIGGQIDIREIVLGDPTMSV